MSEINQIVISGELYNDPTPLKFGDGNTGAGITIVQYVQREGKDPSKRFFSGCAWSPEAANDLLSGKYHKGDKIIISGKLDERKWKDSKTDEWKSQVQINVNGVILCR